jgi:hypothetical protein
VGERERREGCCWGCDECGCLIIGLGKGCSSCRNLMGNGLLGFQITVACCFRDELVEDGCREID